MSHYRGYFMQGERIAAPAIIEATDDAQAMLKAGELLSTSQFLRIDVWQEKRLVGVLSAPASSHKVTDHRGSHASKDSESNVAEFRRL
jgi:hypothetical protein